MCGVFQEYEFLDLSDVKEAELCSLQCALFERLPVSHSVPNCGRGDPAIGKDLYTARRLSLILIPEYVKLLNMLFNKPCTLLTVG